MDFFTCIRVTAGDALKSSAALRGRAQQLDSFNLIKTNYSGEARSTNL
jgi:hypothetical protein